MLWLMSTMVAVNAAEPDVTSSNGTLEPGHCYTWGLSPQLALPLESGQIITEAVLTVHHIQLDAVDTNLNTAGSVPRSSLRSELSAEPSPVTETFDFDTLRFYVLNDPRYGFWPLSDAAQDDDPFAGFGGLLTAEYEQGNLVYRLSHTHDPNAWTAKVFGNPTSLTLANGSPITMSSSLLEFIDYAGTGYGVGFGIRSGEKRYYYDDITLTVTVESYEGVYTTETIVCHLADGPSPESPYTLVITAANGSVAASPDDPSYSEGQTVTLTATASPGYAFRSWSGGITGTDNPTTIVMEGDKSITAIFAENSRSTQRGI